LSDEAKGQFGTSEGRKNGPKMLTNTISMIIETAIA
jgi:hypothetical protein